MMCGFSTVGTCSSSFELSFAWIGELDPFSDLFSSGNGVVSDGKTLFVWSSASEEDAEKMQFCIFESVTHVASDPTADKTEAGDRFSRPETE